MKSKPDFSHHCPVMGPETIGTNCQRFPLHVRKHFFTVRDTEHSYRWSMEVLDSPSLDRIQRDMVLGCGWSSLRPERWAR